MTSQALLSKFKGCLLGGLAGDCLGAPFEGEVSILSSHLKNYFQQILDPNLVVPFKPYTDDTAMVKVAAESLIASKGFDARDMAKRFTYEYFAEPKRGYGSAIHDVFFKLRRDNFEDPYRPAKEQFKGLGSYGNGAAMRVAPVALFACQQKPEDPQHLINLVQKASALTHSSKWGYRGAILQALAIRQALKATNTTIDAEKFLDELIAVMQDVEKDDDPQDPLDKDKSYTRKLMLVKNFLNGQENNGKDVIQNQLGNHVSALNSVPTAIYCALLTQNPVNGIEFAISLGGDTDTIACMAGSILGAQMGDTAIPSQFLVHSEAANMISKLAEDLYAVSTPQNVQEVISSN